MRPNEIIKFNFVLTEIQASTAVLSYQAVETLGDL
jgi:hypothetical protein